jgi:hypothetical protein
MGERNNCQTGDGGFSHSVHVPWQRRFGQIVIFVLARLLLPPLSPWLRVIAVVLAT